MQRKFRLTSATDFKRVRRNGKSFAHPLVVLITLPNESNGVRIGVTAGKAVGNAVARNKVKRWMREIFRPIIPELKPGWDIVVIARAKSAAACFQDFRGAVLTLAKKADLLN